MMNFALVTCMLSTTITAVFGVHAVCPDSHWGPPDCKEHCHCDSGFGACRESDGHCLYGICSPGWMGMPACRTPCTDGHFGRNCMFHCNCPVGDPCSQINGLCDGGKCALGWAGPSCQTRLPVLGDPVQLVAATESSLTVMWRRWNPKVDVGTGPVVYYVLQYQQEGNTTWQVHGTTLESNGTPTYSHMVSGLSKDTAYRFRVILGYVAYDKWVQSSPGMASRYYRTVATTTKASTTATTTTTTTTTKAPNTTTPCGTSTTKAPDITTEMTPAVSTTTTTTTTTSTTPSTPQGPTLPPNPVAIHLLFRNQTSMRVEWKLTTDKFKWCWKKYVVTVETSYQKKKRSATQQVLETTKTEATFTGLGPENEYKITVESVPEDGVLPFTAVTRLWTLPRYILPPSRPKFINATDTTISVMLYGIDDYDATIKGYQVVVEDVTENELDNVPGLTIAVSLGLTIEASTFYAYDQRRRNRYHPNAYVTGRFDGDDVDPDGTVFKIGAGKRHGSIENVKLEKTSEYAVWYLAIYNYRGDSVSQMRRSKETFIPSQLAVVQPQSSGMPVGYIIAIVLGVLLLLLAIAVVSYYVYQRHEKLKYFTKFSLFGRAEVPTRHQQSTQITAPTSRQSSTYKPRRSLYEELDFEASGPPIHVPKAQGVVTDASYVALRNSNPIKVEKLKQYCIEREGTDYTIAEEYKHLPIGLIDSVHAATKPNNALLNRTSHILPYDCNRIKLRSIEPSGEGHDYINASLVKTHLHTFYVVTQCPMNTTMGEFWRMVWEQEVSVIVALLAMDEPDKPEYKAYWPKIDDHPMMYHDVRVSCNGTERSAHYAIRTFYISRLVGEREQIRCVRHYQYVTWTKTGVPKYTAPFLDFMDRVYEGHLKNPKKMLVHCHSGGGRSGMFVAIDTLINEGKKKRQVDVLKCVTKLRQERPNMVKHLRQYKFIYEALVDYFLCSESAASSKGFKKKYEAMNHVNRNMNNSRPQLALEFEAIETLQNVLQSPRNKNNSSSVMIDLSQPFVSPLKKSASFLIGDEILHPNEDEQGLLIARVDSFCNRDAFIVTNHPHEDQVDEFWNLLFGNKCAAVVSLNSSEGCSMTQYLPESPEKPHRKTYGHHLVTVSEAPVASDGFIVTDAVVHPTDDPQKSLTIKNFEFTNWLKDNDAPSVKHMLGLLEKVRGWKCQQEGPVLVHSNRGSDRAMIFCLLWSVIERVDMEGKVNLFRSVLHHRRFIPATVYNANQYRFLYTCVNEYICERPSCLDIASLNDIKIEEEPNLTHQLMLHTQMSSILGSPSAAPSQDNSLHPGQKEPSPTPSQLSAQIQQVALDQTIEDLSTWFSRSQQTVLERSVSEARVLDMPDLDDEDLQKERQKRFDRKLLKLFRVKKMKSVAQETTAQSEVTTKV